MIWNWITGNLCVLENAQGQTIGHISLGVAFWEAVIYTRLVPTPMMETLGDRFTKSSKAKMAVEDAVIVHPAALAA